MTDREQIRRDAEHQILIGSDGFSGTLAQHVVALLAELEQAERSLSIRDDLAAKAIRSAEARLAAVPALVEAARHVVAEGHDGEVTDGSHVALAEALAAYEEAQK